MRAFPKSNPCHALATEPLRPLQHLAHVGKRATDNLDQAFVGTYTTLTLGARYAMMLAGRPLTLQAQLDNATDRNHRATTGNGVRGASLPRTLRVGLKVDL